MQRFRVKQWREIYEEVIIEAVDLAGRRADSGSLS